MKTKYKHKKINRDVLIILSLVFALIVVSVLITTLAYFSSTTQKSGEIRLGELDFCVFDSGLGKQNIVPGDVVNKQMVLINSRNNQGTDTQGLCSILIKFKLLNTEFSPIFTNSSMWTYSNDEYYYNGVILPSESVNLYDRVVFLDSNGNQYQNRQIDLIVRVDAIQAENGAYLEVWNNAPVEWIQKIENILT